MKRVILISLVVLLALASLSPINAHGVHVTPENDSVIVIADESTGKFAKTVIDEMGLNVSVYNFKTKDDVLHEISHAKDVPGKKILAVAYQDVVSDYLSENSNSNNNLSKRILISSSDEYSIKNNLNLLLNEKTQNNNDNFILNLSMGLLLGLIIGAAITAVILRKK